MTDWNRDSEQDMDLDDVVRRLHEHRPEATGLELDRIKLRATARAAASQPKGSVLRNRLVVAFATLGLMAGGTSGVIAAKGGNGNGKGNASKSQYRPGKGCGDKNHTHTGPPGQNKKGKSKPCPPK